MTLTLEISYTSVFSVKIHRLILSSKYSNFLRVSVFPILELEISRILRENDRNNKLPRHLQPSSSLDRHRIERIIEHLQRVTSGSINRSRIIQPSHSARLTKQLKSTNLPPIHLSESNVKQRTGRERARLFDY